jgi:hypothetical protein
MFSPIIYKQTTQNASKTKTGSKKAGTAEAQAADI